MLGMLFAGFAFTKGSTSLRNVHLGHHKSAETRNYAFASPMQLRLVICTARPNAHFYGRLKKEVRRSTSRLWFMRRPFGTEEGRGNLPS